MKRSPHGPISDYWHRWKPEVMPLRSHCASWRTPQQPEASSTVYVLDGFLIDWLCCRIASASQQQQQQQQSYWCYWAAVRYNPIYTWHEARLEQITPNPIRWKGAQLTESFMCACVCVCIHMYVCVCTLVGGYIKITINDLHFSPHWNSSLVQSNDC